MSEVLPAGKTKVIDLMAHEEWKTGKEMLGIICDVVYVSLEPDPKLSDVYKSGSRKAGGQWENLYSPTDVGLRKFLLAGGVTELSYEANKEGARIWTASYKGEYMLPNGKPIPLTGSYEFDCTVGGPRWEVRKQDELMRMVKKHSNASSLNDEGYVRVWTTLAPEEKARLTEVAEFTATKYVNQAAQYGRQRAQTGAIGRAIRKLFLIRSYTTQELTESVFRLVRTTVNYELMKVGLGVFETKMLQMTDMLRERGLAPGDIGDLLKLLAEGEIKKEAAATGQGFFMDGLGDDEAIEGVVEEVVVVDPEEAALYDIKAEVETKGRTQQAMIHYYGWGVFNVRSANAKCKGFFGKKFLDLSEAEMQLIARAYEKLLASKEAGASKAELTQQATHLAEAMKRCVHQKRLWKEPVETAEQLPLEGKKDDNAD